MYLFLHNVCFSEIFHPEMLLRKVKQDLINSPLILEKLNLKLQICEKYQRALT